MSVVCFSRCTRHGINVCRPAFRPRPGTLVSQQRSCVSNPARKEENTKISPTEIRKPPNIVLPSGKSVNIPENMGLFRRVLFQLNLLIEELSHLDEVRASQQRVIELKDNLFGSGQRKRDILYKLSEVRRELKKVHSDSFAIRRGSDGYLALVHNEIRLLKEEESLQATYEQADLEERNLFTSLTTAINDSYEKEKVHANTLRLWGLIGTLFTSIVTLILSTIGHYYHTTQLGLVGSKFENADNISKEVQGMREKMTQIQQQISVIIKNNQKCVGDQNSTRSESWGAYLARHTSGIYRYFFPKKT